MTVYFIRAGDVGPVKIGWAADVEERRGDLQTAHYEPLHLLRTIDGVPLVEFWLHERFAANRLRGEWFSFDADMLAVDPPDLTGWKPAKRLRASPRPLDARASMRADFATYLDSGCPVLGARLAEWMATA